MRRLFDAVSPSPGILAFPPLRAKRSAQQRCVVMCEIDYFRQYEDIYGKKAGDEVQQQIFDAVAQDCRAADVILSRGSAGVAMLVAAESMERAQACADRHRQSVEALQIFHQGSPLGIVTVSMGVAVVHAHDGSVTRKELECANMALGHVMSFGQNRVAPALALT